MPIDNYHFLGVQNESRHTNIAKNLSFEIFTDFLIDG